jgi:hypothetical protein
LKCFNSSKFFFFNRCFDLIYTLLRLHYFLYFNHTLKAIFIFVLHFLVLMSFVYFP